MPGLAVCRVSPVNLPAVLIANGLGACLILAILLGRRPHTRSFSCDSRLFYWMCRLCLALCLLETAGFLLDGKTFAGARLLALWVNVILYILSIALSFFWLCYVDYRLFEERRQRRRHYSLAAIPAGLISLMAVANLFFDVFFAISPDNVYTRTPLFLFPYVVNFGYLISGEALAFRFRKRVDKYLFMPVLFFLLPIYLGGLIQLFCYGVALIWVSVALGLMLLYVNLQGEETFLDPLTNLYNRNYLLHFMDHIAKQAKRGVTTTGILMDINGFKHINDTFGHIKGDGVLREVGQLLVQAANGSAVVVRYGGDEFVILLENASPEQVEAVKARIDQKVAEYNASGRPPLPISLSAGAASFDQVDMCTFFQNMDRNMYAEKRAYYLRTGTKHL